MFRFGRRVYFKCSRFLKETQRCQSTAEPLVQTNFMKGAPHKKHPGVTNLKTVCLPDQLQEAALSILQGAEVKGLAERAHKLSNFLWSRKRAVETSHLREKAILLEKKYLDEEKDSHKGGLFMMEKMIIRENVGDHELEARIRKRVLSELRRTTYHRTLLRYDKELGLLYMAARLTGGYAAVIRALHEIKKRDPLFEPCSLLDFGSGLGTGTWASHTLWGDSLKEYVCVDSSGDMNTLAEQLLKGGEEMNNPLIKQVYFRQFLPVSPKVQFDLVLAAFSLSELATLNERMNVIYTLWRKTNSYLVLVENGTKEGHQILMEARNAILKGEEEVTHDMRRPAVFAPCTHELPCPKLIRQPVVPCNFTQFYTSLPLIKSQERQQEKFSYLIISRSNGEKSLKNEGFDMGRLTAQVHRRPRHVQCQLCCSNGELRQLAVTARHHGKDMYRCARSSDWGDLLPVFYEEEATKNDENL